MAQSRSERDIVETIVHFAHPLIGPDVEVAAPALNPNALPTWPHGDFDPLLEDIGDRSIVLLGEATHGTHEFYAARAEITRRLIEEKGFGAIAIEGDLPDVREIDRFVVGRNEGAVDPVESLGAFRRFPMWMWRNTAFLELVTWLWMHNRRETTLDRVRVFGIDLYSLYNSMRAVISYLEESDPEAAREARRLYACFDHAERDPVRYGRHVRIGTNPSCEEKAVEAAVLLLKRRLQGGPQESSADTDEHFYALRNAELVRNAESYYRNLFSPIVNTWNVRDRHMADTITAIRSHLAEQGRPNKVVIWAHNSHIGDDRATEMGWHGQTNIGRILREQNPNDTFHVGFTTFKGTVTAASEWDSPPLLKSVLPALPGSFESLFHLARLHAFYLPLTPPEIVAALGEERLERAIGVVYSPETERVSHYFNARITQQFDAVIHFDESRAVEPLDVLRADEVSAPSEIQF